MDFYIYPSEFIRSRFESWGLDKSRGMLLENVLDRRAETSLTENVRENSEFEQRKFAFFGQATHNPSAGPSAAFSVGSRSSSSPRRVVKKTTTSVPGFAPSFFESGVPE